jgi:hypothetical protein
MDPVGHLGAQSRIRSRAWLVDGTAQASGVLIEHCHAAVNDNQLNSYLAT